jgi:hypothetical protein
MLWATKYPDQQIDVERVAKELDQSEEKIRATLDKLTDNGQRQRQRPSPP